MFRSFPVVDLFLCDPQESVLTPSTNRLRALNGVVKFTVASITQFASIHTTSRRTRQSSQRNNPTLSRRVGGARSFCKNYKMKIDVDFRADDGKDVVQTEGQGEGRQ
jgi:hypothetical protein